MSDKRLLDYNPTTGIASYHHYDHATKTTTIQEVQDNEPVLEHMKELRNSSDNLFREQARNNEFAHAASIPLLKVQELLDKGYDLFSPDQQTAREATKKAQELWPFLFTTTRKIFR